MISSIHAGDFAVFIYKIAYFCIIDGFGSLFNGFFHDFDRQSGIIRTVFDIIAAALQAVLFHKRLFFNVSSAVSMFLRSAFFTPAKKVIHPKSD